MVERLREKKFDSILPFLRSITKEETVELTEIFYNFFGKRDEIEDLVRWAVDLSVQKTSKLITF